MKKLKNLVKIALFGVYFSGLASTAYAVPLIVKEKNDLARKCLYYGLYSTTCSAGLIQLLNRKRYNLEN